MLPFTETAQYRRYGFYVMVAATFGLAGYLAAPFLSAILWATVLGVIAYPLFGSRASLMNLSPP
jgi:predicted PurR-regulated permease PerM